MGSIKDRKIKEKSAYAGVMRPLKIPCGKIDRNCALEGRCAYCCKEDSQYEDEELHMQQRDVNLGELHFLGTAQWSWGEIWNAAGGDAVLMLNSTV